MVVQALVLVGTDSGSSSSGGTDIQRHRILVVVVQALVPSSTDSGAAVAVVLHTAARILVVVVQALVPSSTDSGSSSSGGTTYSSTDNKDVDTPIIETHTLSEKSSLILNYQPIC